MMTRMLLVCAGGALGSGGRYLLVGLLTRLLGTAFPFGTLAVNVLGSFAISLLVPLAVRGPLADPALRDTLIAGVLGGFTTYSAFNHETLRYLDEGAWATGLGYLSATVACCLAAGVAGLACARSLAAN